MASQRRIESNRRNARNSTGPRSVRGKKRASQNAFRHGLAQFISSAELARHLDARTREIAGDAQDSISLERARIAAGAEFDLTRVRRVRRALIERISVFGRFDVPNRFASPKDEVAGILLHYWGCKPWKTRPKLAIDPLPAMPPQEPERTAEAVRRILPELARLMRYEARAVTRRDRAIRALSKKE